MRKITIELSDDDVEEGMSLLHRAAETVDRLDAIAEDLQELRDMVIELKRLKGKKRDNNTD